MNPLFDLHVHTLNSPDASLSEAELAERAVVRGLAGLGFIAHLDFHPLDPCFGFFNGARYTASVRDAAALNPGTTLLCGVEVGEPHLYSGQARGVLEAGEYDYVTGALHWVDDLLVLGPEAFRKEPPLKLVEGYYRETLEMVRSGFFHILAHMGLFRRGMALAGLDTSLDETRLWPGLLEEILGVMVEKGVILEVNTSGLRRKECVTYPDTAVLELYRSLGGELVTLGSDTHRDPWVFYGLEEGCDLLLKTGYFNCTCLRRGEPFVYPLHTAVKP